MPRTEAVRTYTLEDDRVLTVVLRDTITPEDPYLNLVHAKALSVCTGEAFDANRISRRIKDMLIRTNITI